MNRSQLCGFLIALATLAFVPVTASAASARYTPETLPADFIGTNFALMHGSIALDGKRGYVAFQVRRASARRYLGHTPWRRLGPGVTNANFDAFALNLQADTDYVFRAVSFVGGIQRAGSALTFRTLGAALPPTVSTLAASDLTTSGAVLHGSVNPNGQGTGAWFEWGTTTNYGNTTAVQSIPAGASPVLVLAALSNLVSGTTYHFRVAGTNSTGVLFGTDAQFVTPVPIVPTAVTLAASDLTTNAAVLNGSVNPNGKDAEAWFEWGTTTNYGNATPGQTIPAGTSPVSVLAVLSNLVPGMTYHFRVAGTNSAGISFGADMAFEVPIPLAPSVTTLAASDVTTSGAVLHGSVNPNGLDAVEWFEWGTTTNYGNVTTLQSIPAGTSAVFVQAALSNLVPSAVYHFRVAATNSAGTSFGADLAFIVPIPAAPTVSTLDASNLKTNSAALNGSVNPNGQPAVAWFEWGTTTNYGNATIGQNLSAGASAVPVQASLSNLAANSVYHYRLVASNAGGVSQGNDSSFITLPIAGLPIVLTLAAMNHTTNSATVRASVNPGGAATAAWFEWGPTAGFGNKTPEISVGAGVADVVIETTLSNLIEGSLYYYRVVATNAVGSSTGANRSFATKTTAPCPPEVGVAVVTNCTEADLRAALTNARTVTFACDGVIQLTSPLVVQCALRLDASGRSVVLSGGDTNRIFYVHFGAELELINLTVADGRVTGTNGLPATGPSSFDWGKPGESVQGGGIVVSNATLRAMNCLFTNCSAAAGWGGDSPSINWGRGAAGNAVGGLIFASDAAVTLTNCTLAGNAAVAGWSGYGGYDNDPSRTPGIASGGALAAINTDVSVTNCIFDLNSASSLGGAVHFSGGDAVLLAGRNTFAGNTVGTLGGAINVQSGRALIGQSAFVANHALGHTYSPAYGGALGMAGGAVDILDCDFFGNDCVGGNAVTSPIGIRSATPARGGAVAALDGNFSVSRSTFRGNGASGGNGLDGVPSSGGPSAAYGGAIYVATTVRVTNSTFAGNQARAGSGPGISSGSSYGGAIAVAAGNIILASTTIASNAVSDINGSASFGAGLHRSAGTVSILDSLLAGNLANTSTSENIFGSFIDLGRNLSSDATPVWTSGTSLNSTDPLLGPLSDNGGFTLTFPLLFGSPAIDAADPLTMPATDQRGVARPQGPAPDIGSYEKQ